MTPPPPGPKPRAPLAEVITAAAVVAALGLAATLVTKPLWPARVLHTQSSDLANHVRHVSEYALALAEGQFPPLTAPALNGSIRVPLFQYYSGTAYVLPGALTGAGLAPYVAMKVSTWLFAFASGAAMFGTGRLLTGRWYPSLVAAVAFQLFPFGAIDLHNRGAVPEWVALQCLPIVLYASIRLAASRSAAGSVLATALAAAAWAYFIPVHPSQTAYAGSLIFVLAAAYCLYTGGWRAGARLGTAALSGALLTAWFWGPIAAGRNDLRIGGYLVFLDALIDWPMLLAPRFRATSVLRGWAPQVGLHFVVAAVAALCARPRTRPLPWACGAAFLGLLAVIIYGPSRPWVGWLFRGLQANYRLLIPCALLGAVCLASVLARLDRLPRRWPGAVIQTAVLAYVTVTAVPYFQAANVASAADTHQLAPATILDPSYSAPNSSYYAFCGTDLRALGWLDGDQLVVGRELDVPLDGVPLTFELTLPPGSDPAGVRWYVNGQVREFQTQRDADGTRLSGTIRPSRGWCVTREGDLKVRFETPGGPPPRVADFRCHAGDGAWFRPVPVFVGDGPRAFAEVPRAGLYQLPVAYTPLLRVAGNGTPLAHSSADRFMLVVPLWAGRNEVVLVQHRSPLARTGLVTVCLFWSACGLSPGLRRRVFGAISPAERPTPVPVPLRHAA